MLCGLFIKPFLKLPKHRKKYLKKKNKFWREKQLN